MKRCGQKERGSSWGSSLSTGLCRRRATAMSAPTPDVVLRDPQARENTFSITVLLETFSFQKYRRQPSRLHNPRCLWRIRVSSLLHASDRTRASFINDRDVSI